MDRYLVFAGFECDHTEGGWKNFYASYLTLSEAEESAHKAMVDYGWVHVVDLKDKEIVLEL